MNPLIMYLIVRESLKMSAGKIGAQCGHAAQMPLDSFFTQQDHYEIADRLNREVFQRWHDDPTRKIVVLGADEKEWAKLKADPTLQKLVFCDAGLTEVAAGSETVMALWPMTRDERPKSMQRLQAL